MIILEISLFRLVISIAKPGLFSYFSLEYKNKDSLTFNK